MGRKQRQQQIRALLPRRGRTARIQPGLPPGTLVKGTSAEMPTIDVTTFDRTRAETQKVATIDEALARLGQGGVTWINVDRTEAYRRRLDEIEETLPEGVRLA